MRPIITTEEYSEKVKELMLSDNGFGVIKPSGLMPCSAEAIGWTYDVKIYKHDSKASAYRKIKQHVDNGGHGTVYFEYGSPIPHFLSNH